MYNVPTCTCTPEMSLIHLTSLSIFSTCPALVGMLHVGVFILLLLSGERNFGVRLNKPYVHRVTLPDIPKFSGTHADLLFLVSGVYLRLRVPPYNMYMHLYTCTYTWRCVQSYTHLTFEIRTPSLFRTLHCMYMYNVMCMVYMYIQWCSDYMYMQCI